MTDERPTPSGSNTPRKPKLRRPKPPAPPRIPVETVDSNWRIFLAVPLPADVTTYVDDAIATLRNEPWPVKWTPSGNAHITLHFLGEVDPARADLLRFALRSTIAPHEAFDLRTADLGAFPTIRKPRVLWLGLWGPVHRLLTLHEAIGKTLTELEFVLDEREFHPHITLGRVRSDGKPQHDLPAKIRARFEALAASGEVTSKDPVPLPVNEVQLIRSHLTPQGARYEVLERYPLRAPEPKD